VTTEWAVPVVKADAAAAEHYRRGYWRDADLWTSIQQSASIDPERIALFCDGRSISFAALLQSAMELASGIQSHGIGAGDIAVVHGRNSIESVQALLACAYLGAVMTPVPPMFSEAQLANILASTRAKLVIATGEPAEVQRSTQAACASASVRMIVVPDQLADGKTTLGWSQVFSKAPGPQHRPVDADALAFLGFSSGTTGTPKGVMHSSNTVRYAIEQRSRQHGVGRDDTCLVASQFGFVGSSIFGLLTGMLMGTKSVLMRSWEPELAVRLIETQRVSYALLMPTHVHDLLATPTLDAADVSSFRRGALGGLTRERRLEVQRRLCRKPLPGYGMSECLGNSTCAVEDDEAMILGSDGRAYPGTELLVVDEQDRPVAAGSVGAILVRGPSRCLGYFQAPELTSQAFTPDGYFRTGDLGSLNPDGYLTFAGRAKDIIRRGGVNISPAGVEAVLMKHPRIEHVALVGLPDERLGERACACVITRDGQPIALEEVTSYLSAHAVARYMWPERVERFDSFPRTPSLKVQKPALVALLVKGAAKAS
jgi:non-ribosomal peptide synthetase component E (peptide arylation enzyme)